MQNLFRLWYVQSGPRFLQRYLGTVRVFDGTFALSDTWRNIHRPLFQDYTWQGRLIGVFLRLARIGLGAFVYALTAFIYLAVWLVWLFLPLIFVISLAGGFFASAPSL